MQKLFRVLQDRPVAGCKQRRAVCVSTRVFAEYARHTAYVTRCMWKPVVRVPSRPTHRARRGCPLFSGDEKHWTKLEVIGIEIASLFRGILARYKPFCVRMRRAVT